MLHTPVRKEAWKGNELTRLRFGEKTRDVYRFGWIRYMEENRSAHAIQTFTESAV